nr:integrase, catalytic region, zinc finger, CCHC-type, peptidase aspartic, catalytic [Tanacetum cinerariifolium]
KEEAGIQLQAEEYDLMAAVADLDEIEEVNENCILMANLQQASSSGTQTDSAPVYDSDGSAEVHENYDNNEIFNMFTQEEQYTELLEPILEPQQVPQNDNNVISEVTNGEQGGETVEQHSTNFKETCALYESLYQNLAIEVEKEKSNVSFLLEEKKRLKSDFKTYEDELLDKQIQLEKKIKELNNIMLKTGPSIQMIHMLSPKPNSFYHTEQKMALGYQNPFYLKQAQKKQQSLYDGKVLFAKHDPIVVHDSKETLQLAQEEAAKFVGDFKFLAKEANASLAKHKNLELEIEGLLKAVVSQDIISVVQNASVVDTSDLQTELERNLNEGHLDGGCAKKVNEEVAGDDNLFVHTVGGKENSGSVNKMPDSMGSCRLKKPGMPRTGGSILSFMEEVVKLGQTMGYNMDGCVKDITEIIKSQGEFGRGGDDVTVVVMGVMVVSAMGWPEVRDVVVLVLVAMRKIYSVDSVMIGYLISSCIRCFVLSQNDREDIEKLGAKGDIGFFIGYSVDSCAYRIYDHRIKKIMETMNVSFDELSAMAFEQCSSKPGLLSMTSGQISSELDLTYAPSTITKQQPTEGKLNLLFKAMYDDYFGGQPSATVENVPPAQEPQVRQTSTASTTIADNVPIPTNSSSHATNILITSQDVDELNLNAMIDATLFEMILVSLKGFGELFKQAIGTGELTVGMRVSTVSVSN